MNHGTLGLFKIFTGEGIDHEKNKLYSGGFSAWRYLRDG
jgi:hypothetical protein